MRELDMLNLLRARYTQVRRGTKADRYVRASHVRYPDSRYSGQATRIADYLVLDTYKPHHLLGFEVKVSRADWLSELAHPEKSEVWRAHCHKWYLVVPDPSIYDYNRDELGDWGALSIGHDGRLKVDRACRVNDALPLPNDVLGQFSRAVAKTALHEGFRTR